MDDAKITALERLTRLRDAGGLTHAEFEREKLRILGTGEARLLPRQQQTSTRWRNLALLALLCFAIVIGATALFLTARPQSSLPSKQAGQQKAAIVTSRIEPIPQPTPSTSGARPPNSIEIREALEIPVKFRGRWGEDPEECADGVGIRNGIELTKDKWISSESEGELTKLATVDGGKTYTAKFSFVGMDGEFYESTSVMTRKGLTLVTKIADLGDNYGLETTWVRCS